jgi:hypothetical protein
MKVEKVVLTMFGLIALYLVLANGNAFNTALKTSTDSALRGIAVLQGRNGSVVG